MCGLQLLTLTDRQFELNIARFARTSVTSPTINQNNKLKIGENTQHLQKLNKEGGRLGAVGFWLRVEGSCNAE